MKRNILVSVLIVVLLVTGFGGQVARADDPPTPPTGPGAVSSIYFTAEELETLKALADQPSHQAIWANISSWAVAHVNDSPPAQPVGGGFIGYWDGIERNGIEGKPPFRHFLENMAFMYAMTEDTAYAEAAREWLLELCSWTTWQEGGTYGQCDSQAVVAVGFAYQVLYDYLISAERATIENVLAERVQGIYDNVDLLTPYGNNLFLRAEGMILGALILATHPNAQAWYDRGLQAMANAVVFPDGGGVEGIGYDFIGRMGKAIIYDAIRRMKGIDYFSGDDHFRNSALFSIYMAYNDRPVQLEDCNWWEGTLHSQYQCFLYKVAAEYNDSYAQWFADTYADQARIYSYIWRSPSVAPAPPTDLPLSKLFPDTGYAMFRSGWGKNDLLLVFKSGTSLAHAHPSQNEFGIYNKGLLITGGPGYVCATDYDATFSHNCILVDGKGQCQELGDYWNAPVGIRGRIIAMEDRQPFYRYLCGDASDVYTGVGGTGTHAVGDLDKWLRHIVFIENPNYFVIYDEVAASEPKQFDWLMNLVGTRSQAALEGISVTDDLITLGKNGVQLKTLVVEPENFDYEIFYEPSTGTGMDEFYYIKVRPPTNMSAAEFLTAIFPDAVLPVEEVKIGNCLGVIVGHDETRRDVILFSSDGNPVDQYVELDGYYRAIDGGSYTFDDTRVRAQFDGYQVMRLEELTSTNHAPVLDPIGNKAVYEGQLLEFIVTATDPDGDNLTYSASNLPEGASFDPAAQTFSWTPTYVQAGTYPNVHFGVTDGNLTDVEDITITVKYPPGDANGDGSVDSLDITKLKRIIMGLDDPTPGADANGDGNVNALDITKIELIIMGAW